MENNNINENEEQNIYDEEAKQAEHMKMLQDALSQKPKITEEDEDEVPMEDFFALSSDDIDEFDKKSWSKGAGYKSPEFPLTEKYLEGWSSGLYLFAGESNSGKSATMMNMLTSLCKCESNNLFGIYFTLDDSKDVIIPRIVAMDQKIPISAVAKPQRYQDMIDEGDSDNIQIYEDYLEKRKIGLANLKENNERLMILDSDNDNKKTGKKHPIRYVSDVFAYCKKVQAFLDCKCPGKKLIIAIDSIKDLKIKKNLLGKDDDMDEEVARQVKNLAVSMDIIVLASTHLRKLNANRRPTIDDLRDANTLVYEASVVFLIYNDVSKNKSNASVFFSEDNDPAMLPVIEVDWCKNKISSYKGRTFNFFYPDFSYCQECTEDKGKEFEQSIYQD